LAQSGRSDPFSECLLSGKSGHRPQWFSHRRRTFKTLKKYCEAMNSGAHQPRAGSLTQIKVILSGRAENSARPVQIRPPRPNKSKGFTKMRGHFAPAIAVAMIVPAILPARSDDIPTLDVHPVCRGIASQSELEAGLQRTNFEQCLQSEQAVRDEIKKEWSTFSTADKTHCVALARTGGAACPLLAQSGHCRRAERCPLSGVKRTSHGHPLMSAFDAVDSARSAASKWCRLAESTRAIQAGETGNDGGV
jgi:hypothetical protein